MSETCASCNVTIVPGFPFCLMCCGDVPMQPSFPQRCRSCAGELPHDAMATFVGGRAAEPAPTPGWASDDMERVFAERLDLLAQRLQFAGVSDRGEHLLRHPNFISELRTDPYWARLSSLVVLLAALRRDQAAQGWGDWLFVRPCPHCSERDPAEIAGLLRELPAKLKHLSEVDDRPLRTIREPGPAVAARPGPDQPACPKCGRDNPQRHRFCVNCGERQVPVGPVLASPQPGPIVGIEKPQPFVCLACGEQMPPRAAFDIETRFFSGLILDDDKREPPPDPFAGRIVLGGSRPALEPVSPEDRQREERRQAILSELRNIPMPRHTSFVRAACRPCRACGAPDPFGLA